MLHPNNTTNLTEIKLCTHRIVKAPIKMDLAEGVVWMVIAVISFFLNTYALQSLTKKLNFKRTHRLYLGNVFLCNMTVGSVVYICFMLIKFDCRYCALRDTFFVGIVFFTNVNQLSMICILTCHIGNCTTKALGNSRITASRIIHILVVIFNWIFSAIIVLIMINKPDNIEILVYTICKTVCILILGLFAIRYICKGARLRRNSDAKRKNEAVHPNTAVKIMITFIVVTVFIWCPLLTMIALQNFEIIGTHKLALPLIISIRFVCLGPIIDPLFYFWSKKGNKVSIVRGK